MSEFDYRGYNAQGEEVSGVVTADEREQVLDELEEKGVYPFELNLRNEGKADLNAGKNRSGELILFTKQLASLLSAGVRLGEALELIARMLKPGPFKEVVMALHNSLTSGLGFAEALKKYPRYFSPAYINMIKAGEESGYLGVTCRRLARSLEERKELRSFIISNLFYPAVLMLTALMAIIVMLTFVLPRFVAIYDSYNQSLPWITEIFLLFSSFLGRYGLLILLLLSLIFFLSRAYTKSAKGRSRLDRLLLDLPLIGDLLTGMEVCRLTDTLGSMLKNGVPLARSLEIVKDLSINTCFRKAVGSTTLRVRRGGYFSEALESTGVFPGPAIHLVGVGEQT